jgi:phage gp29-like protein
MQVELINAMAQGNADGFKIMMDWCEATQSKAILGGTLTSQTGANGNRSLGDVHNEVRLDIRNDDASKIDRALSDYLIYPIAVLNGLTDPGRAPRFVSDTQEPDDLALYADALPKLVAIGMTIPARYAHEKLKIPEPDGDEPVLSAGGSGVEGAAPTPDIDPTPVGAHTEQLAREAAPRLDALIDRVRGLVDSADSLDALRDDLLAAYGDLDTRELTNVMALAFACADLAGRHDAREE